MASIPKNDRVIKTVFISDLHLGTKACKADQLLHFLKNIGTPKTLYLVGDIIDLWRMRSHFWTQKHNDVIQQILALSKKGTRIYYITGNHDEYLREFKNFSFGDITVCDEAAYVSYYENTIKIIHGDQFDSFLKSWVVTGHLGAWFYEKSLRLSNIISWVRRHLGLKYWSLSRFIQEKATRATKVVQNFETIMVDTYREQGYNAVLCGHDHIPNIKNINGFMYLNCGDWTENCTAIIEYDDGNIELISHLNKKMVALKIWNQSRY